MTEETKRTGDAIAELRNEFVVVNKDRFSCHHVHLDSLAKSCASQDIPILVESLVGILEEARSAWTSNNVRGVWVEVPLSLSSLIAPLAEQQFKYHHVVAPDHVTLTAWLCPSEPDNLPSYANHSLGVAGVVVREDNNSVLVIQERFYPKAGGLPYWKFPGGLAEVGEDLGKVAQRETLEETGVKSDFVCVLTARHLHHFRWDISDIYVACLMCLQDPNDISIRFDPAEIANSCWMDINEFMNRPNVSELNRHILECYREYRRTGVAIGIPSELSSNSNHSCTVYSAISKHLPSQKVTDASERACL